MRTAVVLPAPFGPSTPSTVPASTVRSTPRNASTGAPLPRFAPKVLRRPSTAIACSPTTSTLREKPGPKPGLFRSAKRGQACEISHWLLSLPQVDWTANEPVASVMFCDAPVPEEIQAHLSAFSEPWMSVQPPAGNWSVMVSAYSCPKTIVNPSVTPALPELTKFWPQLDPMSSW